jgi:hypothetical protein
MSYMYLKGKRAMFSFLIKEATPENTQLTPGSCGPAELMGLHLSCLLENSAIHRRYPS